MKKKIVKIDTMEKIIIEIDKELYRKLLLVSLQNHSTVSEVISHSLMKTFFKEEKKKLRPISITKRIIKIFDTYELVLNDWERNFISNIIENPFELSDKQKETIEVIILKHPNLYKTLDI